MASETSLSSPAGSVRSKSLQTHLVGCDPQLTKLLGLATASIHYLLYTDLLLAVITLRKKVRREWKADEVYPSIVGSSSKSVITTTDSNDQELSCGQS